MRPGVFVGTTRNLSSGAHRQDASRREIPRSARDDSAAGVRSAMRSGRDDSVKVGNLPCATLGIAKAADVWYREVAFVALMSILMRSTRLLGNCPVAIFFGAASDQRAQIVRGE